MHKLIVPCSIHDKYTHAYTLMLAIHTADLTTQSGSLQPCRVSFQVQHWWGVACTLRVLFHSRVLTHGACCSTPWHLHTVRVVLLVSLTHGACCSTCCFDTQRVLKTKHRNNKCHVSQTAHKRVEATPSLSCWADMNTQPGVKFNRRVKTTRQKADKCCFNTRMSQHALGELP